MKTSAASTMTLFVTLATTAGISVDASAATLQPRTVQAWKAYVAATEARIATELTSKRGFLATDFAADRNRTREAIVRGDIPIGKLATVDRSGKLITAPDGLIAHWRGAVFLPGVTLDALLNRLQHPSEVGPHQEDVLALRVLDRRPDHLRLAIRMTRSQVVNVTYDTEHVVDYRRDGTTRASSTSISSRIVEIDDAGTAGERALPEGRDRGILWRMNSYWRYEQMPGGVVVELESLTLSRGIPFGLGAVVEPMIDRIARESIHRTLEHIRRTYAPAHMSRSASAR
jgi:hypothetical protein